LAASGKKQKLEARFDTDKAASRRFAIRAFFFSGANQPFLGFGARKFRQAFIRYFSGCDQEPH
jgi:hypothetical protein